MAKFFVGLTGGIGSGKSAASAEFEHLGVPVVDADIVAREVVEPGQPALTRIADHFGDHILLADGQLDRAQLRQIIFDAPAEKTWLEQLLHPLIRKSIISQLERSEAPYAMLVSPLLFETNQHALVNLTVLIDVPEAIQIERAGQRDNNDAEQIQKIIDSQMPRSQKRSQADIIIDNSGSLRALQDQIVQVHQQLLSLAQRHRGV